MRLVAAQEAQKARDEARQAASEMLSARDQAALTAKLEAEAQSEWKTFQLEHQSDGMFSKHGDVLDTELLREMNGLYDSGKKLSYDEAWVLAGRKLGRSFGAPKPNAAKREAIVTGSLKGNAVQRKAAAKSAEVFKGLDEETLTRALREL